MSLSDKLNSASKNTSTRLCKIGVILVSESLSKEDRESLKTVLDVSDSDPNKVSNVQIARILREEGFDVSNSAVDRHRRYECPCTRTAK
jgi:hypothetical protein